jgi:hypothetical protein
MTSTGAMPNEGLVANALRRRPRLIRLREIQKPGRICQTARWSPSTSGLNKACAGIRRALRLGTLLLLPLVVVASAAGASAHQNGNILLLRGQHLILVTPAGGDVRELTPPGLEVESAA